MLIFPLLNLLNWLKPYYKICRVGSWSSWIFGFGLGSIFFELPLPTHAVVIFFAFLSATASIFVINQYFDYSVDQRNKIKSNLPIASGKISPRNALIYAFLLLSLCFTLISLVDLRLSTTFFIYLVLWTAYSAPSPRLKAKPILDFLVSGFGAGFLPFLIGLGLTQSNIDTLFFFIPAIPLTLFHCGAHIVQTIGDYEADREAGISTFVVRYGTKNGVKIAGFMFLSTVLFLLAFYLKGLVTPPYLLVFLLLLPFSIHPLLRFKEFYENPCSSSVIILQKSVKKYGLPALLIIWIFSLIRVLSWFYGTIF